MLPPIYNISFFHLLEENNYLKKKKNWKLEFENNLEHLENLKRDFFSRCKPFLNGFFI
jgi:hypothetical protein